MNRAGNLTVELSLDKYNFIEELIGNNSQLDNIDIIIGADAFVVQNSNVQTCTYDLQNLRKALEEIDISDLSGKKTKTTKSGKRRKRRKSFKFFKPTFALDKEFQSETLKTIDIANHIENIEEIISNELTESLENLPDIIDMSANIVNTDSEENIPQEPEIEFLNFDNIFNTTEPPVENVQPKEEQNNEQISFEIDESAFDNITVENSSEDEATDEEIVFINNDDNNDDDVIYNIGESTSSLEIEDDSSDEIIFESGESDYDGMGNTCQKDPSSFGHHTPISEATELTSLEDIQKTMPDESDEPDTMELEEFLELSKDFVPAEMIDESETVKFDSLNVTDFRKNYVTEALEVYDKIIEEKLSESHQNINIEDNKIALNNLSIEHVEKQEIKNEPKIEKIEKTEEIKKIENEKKVETLPLSSYLKILWENTISLIRQIPKPYKLIPVYVLVAAIISAITVSFISSKIKKEDTISIVQTELEGSSYVPFEQDVLENSGLYFAPELGNDDLSKTLTLPTLTNKLGQMNDAEIDNLAEETRLNNSEPLRIFNGGELKQITWEVHEYLFYSDNIIGYLTSAGRNIKLTLTVDLLLVNDFLYSDTIKVNLRLYNDGSILSSKITQSSGSEEIDKIVLQTVKNTLNIFKPAQGEVPTQFYNLTLTINL